MDLSDEYDSDDSAGESYSESESESDALGSEHGAPEGEEQIAVGYDSNDSSVDHHHDILDGRFFVEEYWTNCKKLLDNDPQETSFRFEWITESKLEAIRVRIRKNTHIKHLDIIVAPHRSVNMAPLAEMISSSSSLESLDICARYNSVSDSVRLERLVRRNTNVRKLRFICPAADDTIAEAFAEALTENTTLEYLEMGSNKIGNDGTKAFAEMLRTNTTLKSLCWSSSDTNKGGCEAILNVLETAANTTLIRMQFCDSSDLHAIHAKIDNLLLLNAYGRRLLRTPSVPLGLWPHVLGRRNLGQIGVVIDMNETFTDKNASMIYYWLCEKVGELFPPKVGGKQKVVS